MNQERSENNKRRKEVSDACGACAAWLMEGVTLQVVKKYKSSSHKGGHKGKGTFPTQSQFLGCTAISSHMPHLSRDSSNCRSFGTAAPMAHAPSTPMRQPARLQIQIEGGGKAGLTMEMEKRRKMRGAGRKRKKTRLRGCCALVLGEDRNEVKWEARQQTAADTQHSTWERIEKAGDCHFALAEENCVCVCVWRGGGRQGEWQNANKICVCTRTLRWQAAGPHPIDSLCLSCL